MQVRHELFLIPVSAFFFLFFEEHSFLGLFVQTTNKVTASVLLSKITFYFISSSGNESERGQGAEECTTEEENRTNHDLFFFFFSEPARVYMY